MKAGAIKTPLRASRRRSIHRNKHFIFIFFSHVFFSPLVKLNFFWSCLYCRHNFSSRILFFWRLQSKVRIVLIQFFLHIFSPCANKRGVRKSLVSHVISKGNWNKPAARKRMQVVFLLLWLCFFCFRFYFFYFVSNAQIILIFGQIKLLPLFVFFATTFLFTFPLLFITNNFLFIMWQLNARWMFVT